MPSIAYKSFKYEYKKDIEKILSNYEELKGTHKGRRSLDHLFRGGVLLLAAAWEIYIENVLVETCKKVSEDLPLKDLPNQIKKTLSTNSKKEKDELAIINNIGGENWRNYYIQLIIGAVSSLNTPGTKNIDNLFALYLGIDTISSNFTNEGLDEFIKARGEIAHRMKGEEYLKKDVFIRYVSLIDHLVDDTDKFLYGYMKLLIGKTPWNNTYK